MPLCEEHGQVYGEGSKCKDCEQAEREAQQQPKSIKRSKQQPDQDES